MRLLKFYGASDDLFEIDGTAEDEPDERDPGTVEIKDIDGSGLRVHCDYGIAGNACWMVGVAPMDEDAPIPDWPMSFRLGGRGYSAELTMKVPDTAKVSNADEL